MRSRRLPTSAIAIICLLLAGGGRAMAAPGDLDVTWNGTGIVTTPVLSGLAQGRGVVRQSDGKIVAAGFASNGSDLDVAVARYDVSGTPDATFGGTGVVTTPVRAGGDDQGEAVIQQSDGKLVVVGFSFDNGYNDSTLTLVRYLADGMLDPSFGGGTGKVTTAVSTFFDAALDVVQLPDQKLLVTGYADGEMVLARYETDGDLDATFGGTGVITYAALSVGNALLLQPADGKIVVAGTNGLSVAVTRVAANGDPDMGFGTGGTVVTPVGVASSEALALLRRASDDKLVVAGVASNDTDTDVMLVRYDTAGDPDAGFGTQGVVTMDLGAVDDTARAIVEQPDGALVVAGTTGAGAGRNVLLARFTAGGSPDGTFGTSGTVVTPIGTGADEAYGLVLQPNGGLVVGGYATSGASTFATARYLTLSVSTTTTPTSTLPTTTTTTASTTTTTLPTALVPGGPASKATADCYLELQVAGIGAADVQNGQVVSCADGAPCDAGPCGDDRCDVRIAGCTLQADPALPACAPPTSLDAAKIGGRLSLPVGSLLAGPGCTAEATAQIPVKRNKKGKYLAAKSRLVLKGSAKAPKGTSPRKDADKWTIQCAPRAGECPTP